MAILREILVSLITSSLFFLFMLSVWDHMHGSWWRLTLSDLISSGAPLVTVVIGYYWIERRVRAVYARRQLFEREVESVRELTRDIGKDIYKWSQIERSKQINQNFTTRLTAQITRLRNRISHMVKKKYSEPSLFKVFQEYWEFTTRDIFDSIHSGKDIQSKISKFAALHGKIDSLLFDITMDKYEEESKNDVYRIIKRWISFKA